jgi:hypothetical protein
VRACIRRSALLRVDAPADEPLGLEIGDKHVAEDQADTRLLPPLAFAAVGAGMTAWVPIRVVLKWSVS